MTEADRAPDVLLVHGRGPEHKEGLLFTAPGLCDEIASRLAG